MPSTWDLDYPTDPQECERCWEARAWGFGFYCVFHRMENAKLEAHGEFCGCSGCEYKRRLKEEGRA